MNDNTDEEHFGHPPENQPEINLPAPDSETTSPNQAKENMEVHHHQHAAHGKKTWKEFFWEFLMLFLAVFCGFLAEYKLEHVLEHQHEKEFAKLLLYDLRSDSAYFVHRTHSSEMILKKHQQFYDLMTASSKPTDKQILNAFLPIYHLYGLDVTPGTYSQMKTSGSLRYIQKSELINKLQLYYEVDIPTAKQILDNNMHYYSNIIIPYTINHFRLQDVNSESDSVTVARPIIMNRTTQTDQELLNIMGGYGTLQRIFKTRIMVRVISLNNGLINAIKEEYHIE